MAQSKSKRQTTTKSKTGKRKQTKAQCESQNQVLAVVWFTVGLLLIFLALVNGSDGWFKFHNALFGLFGAGAYFVGPVFCYIAIMSSFDRLTDDTKIRIGLTAVTILFISAANQIFADGYPVADTFFEAVKELYSEGQVLKGGGVLGSLFALPLMKLGKPGDAISVLLILFMLFMILTKSTIAGIIKKARRPVQRIADTYTEIADKKQEEHRDYKKVAIDIPLDENPIEPIKDNKKQEPDVDIIEENKKDNKKNSKKDSKKNNKKTNEEDFELDDENKSHIEEIIRRVQSDNKLSAEDEFPENEDESAFCEACYQNDTEVVMANADSKENMSSAEGEKLCEDIVSKSNENTEDEAETVDTDENNNGDESQSAESATAVALIPEYVYEKPSFDLLSSPAVEKGEEDTAQELRQNAERLVDTLQSFGVQTRIVDISRGPAVTRYELQPSAGVKISKITNLADDIALNLAAAGVRIEAPIPNKAAVGIEIPNKKVTFVTLKEILDSDKFEKSKSDVTIALGKDVSGNVKIADIAKMPHLLIAGATGSGKSVCINSIIMSIIFKSDPKDVKLMLVDPKMVELGVYNGIPHLVVPVVNDAKKAAGVLGWAVTEMLHRYQLFAANGVRDVKSFNKMVEAKKEENPELTHMPQIVIIVDELSDLMMAAPRDVEDHICRLAQMARAAGMHLIIATQRPSVDVITGVIKANIPSRIAFAVSSQIDSRTILDMGGAEKLIGQGDMLYYPVGSSKPIRVQGCFVSDEEIERVVEFIKDSEDDDVSQYDDEVIEEIEKHIPAEKKGAKEGSVVGSDGDDEIIVAAIDCVVENGTASTSFLQRKLKLGYARAARIIDSLEEKGIVGPFEGSKPRKVLISKERLAEMKMKNGE